MKNMLAVLLLSISSLSYADSYSRHLSFEDLKALFSENEGAMPSATAIKSTLESYAKFADDNHEPLFRSIYKDAEESDIRLYSAENIPTLIEITRGCARMIIPKLTMSDLDRNNLLEYAQMMNCFSHLKIFEDELERFVAGNYELLKQTGRFDKVQRSKYRVNETMRELSEESIRYFQFIMVD